jgi:hypothetical protein
MIVIGFPLNQFVMIGGWRDQFPHQFAVNCFLCILSKVFGQWADCQSKLAGIPEGCLDSIVHLLTGDIEIFFKQYNSDLTHKPYDVYIAQNLYVEGI